jgi:hypothetical protein
MKIGQYVLLVGLSLFVACGNPTQPPVVPPSGAATATLTTSSLNPALNSSVTFTATAAPADKVAKLELLEGTTVLKTVANVATLEQSVLMGVAGKRSFTARVTDSAGIVATSAVVEVNTALQSIPVVTLSASRNPVIIGGSSTLTALVAASSGIKEVEFFEGITSLGKDSSVPFEMVVTDFTSVGSREFNAVATDNNGLTGKKNITIQAVKFAINITDNVFGGDVLLSPDKADLFAQYEGDTFQVDQATIWSILNLDGSPTPNDGSFGRIEAIAGQPAGIEASKVRYIPPSINGNTEKLVLIQAKNKQDSRIVSSKTFRIKKKGDAQGITLNGAPEITLRVGQSKEFIVTTVGTNGNVTGFAAFTLQTVGGTNDVRGELKCVPDFECELIGGSFLPISSRIKFIAIAVGKVVVNASSRDDAVNKTAQVTVTIVP